MPEPFIGQIVMVAFDIAPPGWYLCDGQQRDIVSGKNDILATILAGKYKQSGDPETGVFRVPDLRGRVPLGMNPMKGNSAPAPNLSLYDLGKNGGKEEVKLTEENLPEIRPKLKATSSESSTTSPGESALLAKPRSSIYATGSTNLVEMECISAIGRSNNEAYDNRQPYLTVNFIIAYVGINPGI
ncbi:MULTISPECIES: phage tail protein [unclassified Coleofasciculus]|uniref:phage tail protein n=1 Tax=unclassified Coleofasciculus TaxID=2692782 RepID=UPI0018822940|nr:MULTISPECIES: tail fiber protein [unclassified Coleofasciculus]MBE9128568.1 tail fiber protein [Coleofasciculus sp. LEGE 07081]MBE9147937.1 tail fiber protein [Coleofasciculus sp. LEGE 07092]